MTERISYKHNERGYFDIYNKLTNKYPNQPTWLFKEIAGLFDFETDLQNDIALDILEPKTRESAYAFAGRAGYIPVEASGSTASLTVILTGAMVKTILSGYQFGGVNEGTGEFHYFEVSADSSSGGTDTITAPVIQKRTSEDISIGTIDSQIDFYELPIDERYENIIKTSISLVIDSLTWTRVDNFDDSVATDRHFVLLYQSNGKTRVQFGDGTYGLKPPLNEVVAATFSTTDGISGIMEADEITTNVGNDQDISSVTNPVKTSGGNDPESVASIVRNATKTLRSKNIVWSEEDLEVAALQADSGVNKSLGVGSTGVAYIYIIPNGGGLPSQGLKDTVQAYVESLTQFGVMPIIVFDPLYLLKNVTASISVRSGYIEQTVLNLTSFSMSLSTSAIDKQVLDYYLEKGIDLARTDVINVLWSYNFTADDNEALEFIVNKWIELLGNRDFREWGQDLEVGDLWIMGNGLYAFGVDIFNLVSPIVNQPATATQIINTDTVLVTTI